MRTAAFGLAWGLSLVTGHLSLVTCHLNRDVIPLDLDRVRGDLEGRVPYLLARADVVLPHVPGAGDHVALQKSFTERAAPVQASIVEGIDGALHVEQGDSLSVGFDRHRGAWTQVR